jgi:hypothetical protein
MNLLKSSRHVVKDAWRHIPALEAACNKFFNGYHEAVGLFSARKSGPRHTPLPNQKERLSPLFKNIYWDRFAI